jgi:very-short-patch-repair endonuclease
MIIYILVGILVLCYLLYRGWKNSNISTQKKDSVLKQRAIFNINQQITFRRLKEILPHSTILAHVSFDALLTTKYTRTRYKYRNMVADFVVLDESHQIKTIIALDDAMALKRPQQAQYQDALLEMAGYSVIRYENVPEFYQLKQDFLIETYPAHALDAHLEDHSKKYSFYSDLKRKKERLFSS